MRALILIVVLFMSCQEAAPEPDIYYLTTDNNVGVYEIGHIEIEFDFGAITGKQVSVINGNDRAIGVYITEYGNDAVVVFSDSWIGGMKTKTQEAVFYEDEELLVEIVVYKSLGGAIQTFISSLGEGFFSELNDSWIETTYEQVIILQQ
ncbi:hypothetical protein ISR92_00970 [Patescibacteria group bacterium]|nr:hypothetical protein [Patescibacteria group bacterium]